ncbi:MAG: amino acid adenylation domain-containing protein [Cyanobacteria bacterium P01_F01_bin.150]
MNGYLEADGLLQDAQVPSGTAQSDSDSAVFQQLKSSPVESVSSQIKPTHRDGPLALSFAQQRLWFLEKMGLTGNAYTMPLILHLKGQLDHPALQTSLNQLVARHEPLRTRLEQQGSTPLQRIDVPSSMDLPLVDLSPVPRERQVIDLHSHLRQANEHSFNLEAEPPIRAQLFALSETEHVLLILLHHIASDGWSLRVLAQDLSALYEAALLNQPSRLSPLPIQYADFAMWQRQGLQGETLEEQLNYWKTKLQALTPLQLPTDHPRPAVETFNGASAAIELSADLTTQLNQLAQQSGSTLFMALLAGFKVLLSRYTGQDGIAVGSPIANRNSPEFEGLIGCFANSLVMHTDLSGHPSFNEVLSRVRQTALGAYAHQDIPFEKLVEELQPESSSSRNPLFQVMFALQQQEASMPQFSLPDLEVSGYRGDAINITTRFDIELHLWPDGDELKGLCTYNQDLFEPATIQRLLGHYRVLLESIILAPDTPIGHLALLPPSERQQLLVEWNQTATTHPTEQCIHQLFEAQVQSTPNATAVVFDDQRLSYSELSIQSNRLAHYLHQQGVQPGDLVGICIERSVEMVVGLLAILKAGGAYVPLDASYPQQRLNFMVNTANVSLLLTHSSLQPQFVTLNTPILCVDTEWSTISQCSAQPMDIVSDVQDLAYVIFTSGSTGQPKGVAMGHGALVNLITWQQGITTIDHAPKTLQFAPISFDVSFQEIFSTWCTGGTLVLCNDDIRREPQALLHLLAQERIERLFLPFVALQQLAEVAIAKEVELNDLKEVFTAGEQLQISPAIARWFTSMPHCQLQNQYGPSESHVVTAFTLKGEADQWPLLPPIGRPIANSQMYLLDNHQQPVAIGMAGELYIGGVGLAQGYINRPDLTQKKFIANPFSSQSGDRLYRTGDLARYRPDGTIEFLGRIDHQVKIRGFRIELEEVSAALFQHPDVQDVVVIVREDTPGNKRLVAYLVCDCSITSLRAFATEHLPAYMIPSVFVKMDALPLTPNGKVNRRVLPMPEQVRPDLDTLFAPPRTNIETKLAEIWLKALNLDRVGIYDDFFELGGHSLLATQIFSDIIVAFQADLPVSILLDSPTISDLGKKIEEWLIQGDNNRKSNVLATIVPDVENRYSPFPLNDMQRAYWLGRSSFFELGNVAIHLYFEVDSTDFDIDRFNNAWNQLVKRHDMLRAVVLPDGRQQILAEVPEWQVQVTDLRGQDRDSLQQRLDSTRRDLSHLIKPIEQWPQFEIQALRVDEQFTRLYLSFDGWCFDGWSYQVLFREMVALYEDTTLVLPSLNLSFRDYVLAVQDLKTSPAFAESLSYWEKRVPTLPPAPELPLAINPKTLETPRFKRYSQRISSEVWQQLKARAQRLKLTPTVVLLTAYAEILALWSNTPRFTINVPRFNRFPLHPQVNDIIGEFVSFTLLEVDHSTSDSFTQRAQRLQRQLWQDLAHQYVSGIRVLGEIAKFRNVETKAVSFPVVFTTELQDISRDTSSVKGTSLGSLGTITEGLTQTSQVHIDNIYFEEADETLVLNWDTVEDLFPSGMIDEMFTAYVQLLMQLAQDEAVWQETGIQRLVPTKQLEFRAEINDTIAEVQELTLHDLFAASVRKHPDNIAIVAGDYRITYGQLCAAAYRLAQQLKQLGVKPNHLVPVVMGKGWEQVVAVLGVLISGGAYVPIDPDLPPKRLQYLLSDTQASLVLTQIHLVSVVQEQTHLPCISIQSDVDTIESDLPSWSGQQRPEDLAYVIYTSGTTGTPKGVMINHLGAVNTVLDINNRFNVSPIDRVLAVSALSFDLSVYDVFGTLAAGGTIVIPDGRRDRDPSHWMDLIQREGVTVWNTVPALMQVLVDYVNQKSASLPRSLQLALLSGDWLPLTLPKRIRALGSDMDVISLGGATEASIWSILYPIQTVNSEWKSIPYGKPMVNQQFHVLNHALEPCPVWVPGQMYIGGIGLAQGYWQNEQKTASSFIVHPRTGERLYRTGDLGRYLPDGNIEFLGRVDFQLKVRGYRIESGEIETALMQHPEVEAAIINVFSDVNGEQQLVAYYTLASDIKPSREQLQQWLKERLPHYMIPSIFTRMDTFPLTANGKVNRRQLPEPIVDSSASLKFVAPRTPVEAVIAGIWADIAGLEAVGVHDDFFLDLSGNSLLAIQVATAMRETLQLEISLRHFFEAPTVAQQADSMLTLSEEKARLERTAQLLLSLAELSDSEIDNALATETQSI